jgi:hypothetical protein
MAVLVLQSCSRLFTCLLFMVVILLAVHSIHQPVGHLKDVIVHLLAVHGYSWLFIYLLFMVAHLLAVHGCSSSCCSGLFICLLLMAKDNL